MLEQGLIVEVRGTGPARTEDERWRYLSESDTRERPFVAVVSESFARNYWPGLDPLGRRFRMALGARKADIVALVMRQGVVLATAGVVVGLVVAYAAGRAMQALLVGVSPRDALNSRPRW